MSRSKRRQHVRGFGDEARLRWSESGNGGYMGRRMPRLEAAGRRTTREEIYGSSERGHAVSKCESEGCRR